MTEQQQFWSGIVRDRRATPSFDSTPVPDADLKQILTLGLEAPSAYNLQPWRFIVVRDPEQRAKLRAAAFGQPKVEEAPVMIVACADTAGWREDAAEVARMGVERGLMSAEAGDKMIANIHRTMTSAPGSAGGYRPDFGIWANRQVMIAFTTIMWTAEVMGYDTAPMEGFDEEKMRALLKLPESVRVCALLGIGKRKGDDKKYGGRFPLSRTVFGEEWGGKLEI